MTYDCVDNSLGDEGVTALAGALPHLVNLTSLDLCGTLHYLLDVDMCIVCGLQPMGLQ